MPARRDTLGVMPSFVSRAGQKLDHALTAFALQVHAKTCADLGCSTGGVTHCLLQRGAPKRDAGDTGYGVLGWKLRNDPRGVGMETTQAMHGQPPPPGGAVPNHVAWA